MWGILRNSRTIHHVKNTYCVFKETKRLAGHSKWSNIKHIKAEKDGERAALFAKFRRQMRVAIAEGGSCKPSHNTKLAQIIEVAKKKSMPAAAINDVLMKAATAPKVDKTAYINLRGPNGCFVIVELITDNIPRLKQLVHGIVKKYRYTVLDQQPKQIFEHKGLVTTEPLGDLSTATDDAIQVGAEDVEEIVLDSEKQYQFTCDGTITAIVANKLSSLNYKVVMREEHYVPLVVANLTDEELKKTEALYSKLEALDEVVEIHDNIA